MYFWRMKSKRSFFYTLLGLALLVIVFLVGASAWKYYRLYMKPNVRLENGTKVYLYIPTNATFENVLDSLRKGHYLTEEKTFVNAAEREHYTSGIKAGRYQLKDGMSNKSLLRMLSLGSQSPVNLVIAGNIRNYEKLAAVLSRSTEPDSLQFLTTLLDTDIISEWGFNRQTLLAMIIPNTYQVYWNSTPENLLGRLDKEYEKFWNEERREKAAAIPLTPLQVSTLASIVNEETNKQDEMPRVAGVYINRLKKDIPLQADPTLRFSLGDFAIKRVLNVHKNIESPYNTYKYSGLPPGPICIPSIAAIDAVLNYEKHDYLYFCAKDDFSGYHTFAKTLAQHNQNAAKYQEALNKNKVYR